MKGCLSFVDSLSVRSASERESVCIDQSAEVIFDEW